MARGNPTETSIGAWGVSRSVARIAAALEDGGLLLHHLLCGFIRATPAPKAPARRSEAAAVLIRRPVYRRGLRGGVAAAVEQRLHPVCEGPADDRGRRGSSGSIRPLRSRAIPSRVDRLRRASPGAAGQASGGDQAQRQGPDPLGCSCSTARRIGGDARVEPGKIPSLAAVRLVRGQVTAFPGTEEVGRTLVPVARLDSLLTVAEIAGPALLKVDVQGHEYEALEGCSGILPVFSQIAVEASFVELDQGQRLAGTVTALLENAGFSLAGTSMRSGAVEGFACSMTLLFDCCASSRSMKVHLWSIYYEPVPMGIGPVAAMLAKQLAAAGQRRDRGRLPPSLSEPGVGDFIPAAAAGAGRHRRDRAAGLHRPFEGVAADARRALLRRRSDRRRAGAVQGRRRRGRGAVADGRARQRSTRTRGRCRGSSGCTTSSPARPRPPACWRRARRCGCSGGSSSSPTATPIA